MKQRIGIYGTEQETYFVNSRGEVYLVQSPDMTADYGYQRLRELPSDATELPDSVTGDLEIPDEIR